MMHRLAWFGAQAARSIAASPVVQLVAVSTIAVALMVLGAVGVALVNLDGLVDRWRADADLVVFPRPGAAELPALAARIEALDGVAGTRTLDRDAALADLRAAFPDDAPLLDGLDRDLLPAVIEVRLAERDPARRGPARAAVAEALRAMQAFEAIDAVDDGADLVARLERLRTGARAGGAVMAALALLAVVFIISNTIRLTLFARRDELEIMRLVGATDLFIRAPCYLEGALQGAAGALLATGGLWLLMRAVPADGLLDAPFGVEGGLRFLPPEAIAAGVLGAALVGVLASHLATGRFIREGA